MSSSISPPAAAPLEVPIAAARDAGPSSDATQAQVLELFDAAAVGLRRYVQSCGVPPDAAEDIVQDAFVALFRHLRHGGGSDNLRGWLVQVSHRLALKYRERQAKRHRHESPRGWELTERVADTGPDPAARLASREERRRLIGVFNALPELDRRCLSLRAEGLRYREIAAALGISLGSVAKSVTRAVSRLSRAISR
jgi:RNA polymerase sigma-70 factor (ECF subfamily)